MVVDDEADNSTIFKIALEDDGFDVDTFNDSTAALSAFKPNYYDALIFDIKMPLDAADTVVGFFGFNRITYSNIKKGRRKWFEELREQRARDIETEMI